MKPQMADVWVKYYPLGRAHTAVFSAALALDLSLRGQAPASCTSSPIMHFNVQNCYCSRTKAAMYCRVAGLLPVSQLFTVLQTTR